MMLIFKRITALLAGLILLLTGNILLPAPVQKSVSELNASELDFFDSVPMADTVYVISPQGTQFEKRTLDCLQGLAAKAGIGVYLLRGSRDEKYLALAQQRIGFDESRTDADGNAWTLWTLLKQLKGCVDGYIVYKDDSNKISLNMACSIAGVEKLLAVESSIEDKAVSAGLEKKRDITGETPDLSFEMRVFNEYKDRLNNSLTIHLHPDASGLRDLGVSQGAFIFFVEETVAGRMFRCDVFKWAKDSSPVFGWALSETKLIEDASSNGCFTIPSDFSMNTSFYVLCPAAELTQNDEVTHLHTDETKHYAALVMSDGDNSQWIENGFGHFAEKASRADCDFPVSWTFAPLQYRISPFSAEYMYSCLPEGDSFISGPSGVGYVHPSEFQSDAYSLFTDCTAYSMYKSDMSVVTLLDEYPDNTLDEKNFIRTLSGYARYDNIVGGILQLYPGCYDAGKGKVYFSNGKPFASVRLSLWHPDGEGAEVTEEWLKAQADTVNAYAADIHSVSGYSVINVHPWTMSVDSLAYFVSCLDDDVVLVSAQELLTMIEQNVPHETAAP